jgi:hypothetical protein
VIKRSQQAAVQKALSTIEDLITGLSNAPGFTAAFRYGLPDRICPRNDEECEAMILGTLLKSARAEGLWPTPLASSFTKTYLLKGLRALRVQSYCGKTGTTKPFGQKQSASHGIQDMIIKAANKLENSPADLKLEDFKSKMECKVIFTRDYKTISIP